MELCETQYLPIVIILFIFKLLLLLLLSFVAVQQVVEIYMYLLASVASVTLPIKAELYETTVRFPEEAIESWSTASSTNIARNIDAPAAATPATWTAAGIFFFFILMNQLQYNLSRLYIYMTI